MNYLDYIPDYHKEWIDNANYYELLKRWRFSDSTDNIFHDVSGEYYSKIMSEKKYALNHNEQVRISKLIGWEK